ncbi:Signal transduction histidine kinase [Pseudoxanthomonas sp. GM95]|uniref:ATP-binding protein n=1 Tax=Pseudoxanthomonas sp. GM95 TaxID=1881043 RepID=UPI0008B44967|nr:ATP-binding protein [Pseudoxanthomonas sp. GM95]SEM37767.1 Signal transduction histidine kinase [Pseudoxanthomonas sp. GM95]
MKRLRGFFGSLAGRLFLILVLGMSAAAIGATLIANARRTQDFDRQLTERTAERVQGYVELLDGSEGDLRRNLLRVGGPSMRLLDTTPESRVDDPAFAALLQARGGVLAGASSAQVSRRLCMPDFPRIPGLSRGGRGNSNGDRDDDARDTGSPGDRGGFVRPSCRLVTLQLSDGTPLRLAVDTPPLIRDSALAFDPVFLGLLALAIVALSYFAARMASAPVRRLGQAAAELGQDLQRPPMALTGSSEVQRAASRFNAMQARLQRHLAERTHMLAAITHDLQTPLTRLRLRLENVDEPALRDKLIGDLAAMQALIREGLELARSAESAEEAAPLDMDSLLESLVEDAVDAGDDATFEHRCDATLTLRPLAMRRLFSNLIDNALKYGHSAHVAAHADAHAVTVTVRDRGPGLREDERETVFDPFVRLETSRSRETGGAGLGLTIARALAEKDGATLTLHEAPGGGLEARVVFQRAP